MRKKIVAGNWKMNKTLSEGLTLVDQITEAAPSDSDVLKIIVPPFIHLAAVAEKLKSKAGFEVAAQNCHQSKNGAFTGEVSAEMIASAGARYVIIGHSERRIHFGETSALLAQKVSAALASNLIPIFCLGESLEDRNANVHLETVKKLLKEGVFHLLPSDFSKIIIADNIWDSNRNKNIN